jgi:hypothetical protein
MLWTYATAFSPFFIKSGAGKGSPGVVQSETTLAALERSVEAD